MATIEEMAKNTYYPTLAEKAAYWDGANAVLEAIEDSMNLAIHNTEGRILDEDSVFYNGDFTDVYNKVKELKGE